MGELTALIILVSLNFITTTALLTYGLYRQYRFFVVANESMLGSRFDPRGSDVLCDIYRDRLQAMVMGTDVSPSSNDHDHIAMREFNVDIPIERFEIVPGSVRERQRPNSEVTDFQSEVEEIEEQSTKSSTPIVP